MALVERRVKGTMLYKKQSNTKDINAICETWVGSALTHGVPFAYVACPSNWALTYTNSAEDGCTGVILAKIYADGVYLGTAHHNFNSAVTDLNRGMFSLTGSTSFGGDATPAVGQDPDPANGGYWYVVSPAGTQITAEITVGGKFNDLETSYDSLSGNGSYKATIIWDDVATMNDPAICPD